MDKVYNHKDVEDKIYKQWEERGYFQPEINPQGQPYCIILPPPNANGDLHFGHAMFTVEDILIRYHRMKGYAALWLPGTDHAGIETQFVFEKKLQAEGKSRFDYDQDTLYQMIFSYVEENKGRIQNQLRKLGFSLDWSREKYTLEPDIKKLVCKTFKKMYDEGLVYRDYRLVNFCTKDGTSFSDLEVIYEERKDPLYYIKYGPLTIATTRPETKFGDTGVAVHPSDKRYQKYIGKEIKIETVLGPATIKVVADTAVDPAFGTGVVKVTPAHDFTDFEIGKRHGLPLKQVIGYDGKLNEHAGKFAGLSVSKARSAIVEEMKRKGLIEKIDEEYVHRVGLCYKCKTVIEPLPKEQWFVKVALLKKIAIEAVRDGKIKIFPKSFESQYFTWLENLRDWNISRQIVWGIRIPAFKNVKTGQWIVTEGEKPQGDEWEQDSDTFDTWFSSGQWPYVTLQTTRAGDFEKFYPTDVLETGYDLLRAWVSRMVMLGLYMTGKVPFKHVLFHGLVNDPYGKKMSKSKGNVVNPLELIERYGADAVRLALIYGNATGNDQSLSYSKLDAARKFTNKLWNMARFIHMKQDQNKTLKKIPSFSELKKLAIHSNDREWVQKVEHLASEITRYIDAYQFNLAAERLYEFIWHEFADKYIEDVKTRINEESLVILVSLFITQLKLLHPFMPFVTEAIYQKLIDSEDSIMISSWPAGR
ncbi:MAG: valine--tRNA ligase [Patescibacteria group bacterium]|nr:MAG: valine--tRNA ligase [Patescibacteria group bacterium]